MSKNKQQVKPRVPTAPVARRAVVSEPPANKPSSAGVAGGLTRLDGESDADFQLRVAEQLAASTQSGVAEAAAKKKAAEDAAKAAADTENAARIDAEVAAKLAADAREQAARLDLVDVVVPKAFNLTLDNTDTIKYPDGTYKMPRAHAEHWYAKANGVRLYSAG